MPSDFKAMDHQGPKSVKGPAFAKFAVVVYLAVTASGRA